MKISVVIATRNRKDDVCFTISKFQEQIYDDFEIIVVDNNSTDGTGDAIKQSFPSVIYHYLPDNIDILAQNIGVAMSSGEIIWRTDSDSYPADLNTFSLINKIFTENSDVDIIASEEVYPKANYRIRDYYPLPHDKVNVPTNGYKSYTLTGPGSAIRKSVFDKIDGFWQFGHEELDFCTRAILAGFNVRYFPNIITHHFSSLHDRPKVERWIKLTAQLLRYSWKYFPFHIALGRTVVIFLSQLLMSFKVTLNPLYHIEALTTNFSTIIRTIRTERQVVPSDKLYDITLGTSILKNEIKMFTNLFKNKLSSK